MKHIIIILAALAASSFIPMEDDYTLTWADEFNKDGAPDPAKWDYEHGFVRNNEPQWYQPENASVKGGFLVIEAKKERVKNTRYDSSSKQWQRNREYAEYTSACLITKGKFDFKYGKVTMRAKIDIRKGQWPAFWMLGNKRGSTRWPACGEVDIMEFYRGNLLANACWEGEKSSAWDEAKWPVADMGGAAWSEQFHEWQLIWDEQKMIISVDGKELNHVDMSKTINVHQGNNPFQENFFLLLNLALGQAGEEIPAENIPSKFVVDYVRVYQKK
ncbi:family 16 glycosylhydrolase [Chitinophaga sp. SYP-B3965]|uniref:glycoside hydrolase family 16 protein n=1 Tax=Chitinophaga sp. SYP-B3965 TaxID=2663120 RepID=UPI00129A04F5|nr:glycoside hydrolase family 16 protein [Chitinophaga sp. SYP-B3965]MRG44283.1 family 16 glycosylhydrolase [Chitinophaga sp. SYP-B3965]